jgi:hypothetical protein
LLLVLDLDLQVATTLEITLIVVMHVLILTVTDPITVEVDLVEVTEALELAVVEVFTALLVAEDFTVTVAAMEAHKVEHHLQMVEPEEPDRKTTILVQEWADLVAVELVS